MKFLGDEVEGEVAANNNKGLPVSEYSIKSSLENFNVRSKPNTKGKKNSPFFPFCETAEHWLQHCNSVTDIEACLQKLKGTNRCFLCTNRGKAQKIAIVKTNTAVPNARKNKVSICKTATIFVSSDLVNSLKLPIISTRSLELQAFESPSSFTQTRKQVQFQFSSIWDKSKVNIIAFESLNKYASHPPPPTDVSRFAKNKRLKFADPDDSQSNLPIEILIGADFYWNVGNSEFPVKLSDSLTLVQSIFGCILRNSVDHTQQFPSFLQFIVLM
ncbi:integrase catalytic domain-containing protein [Nephila pilipes]|uniref:Integrase catalytic domain-containing protein n=1 Tax=Nephila pilipes TaxID=299642 RepID=A0A8X6QTH4_NEPPI|nr:integrase catalytic domain-containing protein [Nephila pilipes]